MRAALQAAEERERATAERERATAERERDLIARAAERERDLMAALRAAERERDSMARAAERERDLIARLASLQVEGASPPPAPSRSRLFHGVAAVLEASRVPGATVSSPSKAAGFLQEGLACFEVGASPQTSLLAHLSQSHSLEGLRGAAASAEALLREEVLYPLATAHVPRWVSAKHRPASLNKGASSASKLFLPPAAPLPAGVPRVIAPPALPFFPAPLPWACQPELLTVAAPFHPAYNGESKSAKSSGDSAFAPKMFDELATYCALGVMGALFRGVPVGTHRFFATPPIAYGLAAFPHVGYLIALEWLGKLHASVVSQPFFLGSPEHAAAVEALPDHDFAGEVIDIAVEGVSVAVWPLEEGARARVVWSLEGGADQHFFKLIPCDAFAASFFTRLARSYAALAAAWVDASDPPPPSLARAALLFGAGEVCVRMPWIEGRDADAADLTAGGRAVKPVARAIAWLARHALLYTDLRPPNVRVLASEGAGAVLVDYDDLQVLPRAPASFAELFEELTNADVPFARGAGAGALPDVMSAIAAEWGGHDASLHATHGGQ